KTEKLLYLEHAWIRVWHSSDYRAVCAITTKGKLQTSLKNGGCAPCSGWLRQDKRKGGSNYLIGLQSLINADNCAKKQAHL
ncbi:hypothetical protein BIW11_06518, partial [Tropilaelaps mercedesae]